MGETNRPLVKQGEAEGGGNLKKTQTTVKAEKTDSLTEKTGMRKKRRVLSPNFQSVKFQVGRGGDRLSLVW